MMKQFLLAISLSIFCITLAFGQKEDPQGLLKKASEKAASYQSISAEFTYTLTNTSAKLNDSQKGKLMLKGNKYRLDIAQQTILCDGKTIWTIMPDAKEVQINNLDDMEDVITPSKIFSDYYKNFTAKSVSDKVVKGTACRYIELIPNDNKDFVKASLTVAKVDLTPQELQMTDKKGTIHTYTLDNFKTNQSIDDGQFSLKKENYPGYDVIDMR